MKYTGTSTRASCHAYIAYLKHGSLTTGIIKTSVLQLSYLFQNKLEYGLSKDSDVALWLDYRAYTHQPDLVEAFDFVIVNSLHHNEFDDFKKAETDTDNRNFEMNSLLHFYIRQHPQSGTFVTKKYGKTYLTCTCGQVDELCQWIYDMRKQHPKSKLYICMRVHCVWV